MLMFLSQGASDDYLRRFAATEPGWAPRRGPSAGRLKIAAFILTASLLSGCAVGPNFVIPETPEGAGYAAGKLPNVTQSAPAAGGASQQLATERDVPGEWWRLFRSKQISALVAEAVQNHPNVAAAEAALRQAREVAEADAASLLPQASSTNSVTRQQVSAAEYRRSVVEFVHVHEFVERAVALHALQRECRCVLHARPVRQDRAHHGGRRGRRRPTAFST